MYGVTSTSRFGRLVGFTLLLCVLATFLVVRWGFVGFAAPALLLAITVQIARNVVVARRRLWRVACDPLGTPAQLPLALGDETFSSTALALRRLALAVDHVRWGRVAAAGEMLPLVDVERLRPEERSLFDAAAVANKWADQPGAQRAASDEIEARVGRALIANLWRDPPRLAAINAAWRDAGVGVRASSRLQQVVRVHIDPALLASVHPEQARNLSEEARALGDEDLALDLAMRAQESPYR